MTGEGNSAINPAFARRVVIENVQPQVDCGRFPIKRTIGDRVTVTADIFADGHDILYAVLRHGPEAQTDWDEVPMEALPTMFGRESLRLPARAAISTPCKPGSTTFNPGAAIWEKSLKPLRICLWTS